MPVGKTTPFVPWRWRANPPLLFTTTREIGPGTGIVKKSRLCMSKQCKRSEPVFDPRQRAAFLRKTKTFALHPSQKTVLPTCDEGGARPRHPCIAADAEAPAAGGAGIKLRGARRRVLSGSILLFTKPPRGAQTTRGRSVQEGGKVTFLLPVFCRAPHHQSGNCATTVAPSSRQDPSAATAADMCPPTQTLVAARACVTLTPSKRTGKARERWRDATKRGGLHCLPVRVECTGASICKLCLDQSETTRKYDRAQDSGALGKLALNPVSGAPP